MINSENENRDKDQVNPEDVNETLINKNAKENEKPPQNWDEKEILNRNTQGQRPEFERSNLQADREKRAGSGGLDPDRNSGDR